MNNKLVLAPSKEMYKFLLFFSVLFIIFPFFVYIVAILTPNPTSSIIEDLAFTIIFFCIAEAILLIFVVLLWMQNFKTYELDDEGLCVIFWKYKKKYFWKEFVVKKLENYEESLFYKYREGVVFSTKQIKGSGLFSTHEWYSVIHFFVPLSSPFFVDFKENIPRTSSGGSYRANKEELLTALKGFGVEIEQG